MEGSGHDHSNFEPHRTSLVVMGRVGILGYPSGDLIAPKGDNNIGFFDKAYQLAMALHSRNMLVLLIASRKVLPDIFMC